MIGLTTIFFIGLLGSVHCAVMCGGISSALNLSLHQSQRRQPVRLLLCVTAYQAGRILSYVLAGALAAGLAGAALGFVPRHELLIYGNLIQAAVLVLLGLYLVRLWRGPLAALERLGLLFWQRLAPLRKRIFPVRGPAGALAMGLVWGWLPCGLTYSALITAMAGTRPGIGALYMLFFGLGTLPALLTVASVQRLLMSLHTGGVVRAGAGGILLVLGIVMGTGVLLDTQARPLQPFGGLDIVLQWCLARWS